MKALKYSKARGLYMERNVSIPEIINPNNVIVKMLAAGICGTDLSISKGNFPVPENSTLGHELCGVVHKIGSEVKNVTVGQRVAIDPTKGCNSCYFCDTKIPNMCPKGGIIKYRGLGLPDGGMAQYILTDDVDLHPIPDDLTSSQAVLIEPLSCLLNAWKISNVASKDHSKVLILGGGIGGLHLLNYLDFIEVKNLFICQRSEDRRKRIEKLAYKNVTVVSDVSLQEEYLKHSEDELWGFDNIIDCTGNPDAIQTAYNYLRPGGRFVIYGCCPANTFIKIPLQALTFKEKHISGAFLQPHTYGVAVENIVKLARSGRLELSNYGVQEYSIDDYKSGFADLNSRKITKGILLMD